MIRRDLIEIVTKSKSSHIASGLSIADIVAVLYSSILTIDPTAAKREDRDRFILSKGHATAVLYCLLARLGFVSHEDLKTYSADGSNYMPHASHKVNGVEFSTGSLGHGLPFGTGKALAAKKQGSTWRTYVLMSDGELDEGSNWEAFLFAAHHRLDNLTAIIDYNKLQSLGPVSETLSIEPLVDKFKAFGWSVIEVDGHNHNNLRSALAKSCHRYGAPLVIIAHTTKGKGVSFMENSVEWHYKSPSDEQCQKALGELDNA